MFERFYRADPARTPAGRRHRARPVHRGRPGRRPRRHRRGRQRPRPGGALPGGPPAGSDAAGCALSNLPGTTQVAPRGGADHRGHERTRGAASGHRTLALVPDASPRGPGRSAGRGRRPGPQRGSTCWRPASGGCTATSRRASRSASAITIADNASTDATWLLAKRLAERAPGRPGRPPRRRRAGAGPCGRSGGASDAAVVAYMDVDLSTGLEALLPLVAPLVSGHSDLAIGTRLANGAAVVSGAEAGADLALLQPAAAGHPAGPLQRRPVRLQGGPDRGRAGAAAGRRGRGLVLRHRAAAGRRARRPAHPRGARSTGSTTPTAGSTSSAPPWTTCAAWPGWPAGGCAGSLRRLRRGRSRTERHDRSRLTHR